MKVAIMCLDDSNLHAQRKLMRKDHMKPGTVMEGFVAGLVLESQNADWEEGDLFGAKLPFITEQTLTEGDLKTHTIWKLTDYITEDQISLGVGILGMPGATAHAGVKHVLRPKEGETLFVSAACGAVGSMAGQIAKHVYKCTVIGSCGGPHKCDIIRKKFGFDHAVDYKQCRNKDDLIEAIRKFAPDGLDMAYENVGGMHFDAAYALLKPFGRIAVCGSISTFNNAAPSTNDIDLVRVLSEALRIEGFTVWSWLKSKEFLKGMSKWWKEGKIKVEETDHKGIEEWPNAFRSLFTGGNIGKVVVRVA
jgi:NADPH-dependent curcumin reductase CurA